MALSDLFRAAREGVEPRDATDRVLARVHATRRRRRVVAIAAGLAMAAVFALVLRLPGDPPEPPVRPLDQPLVAANGRLTPITDAVSVAIAGEGHLRGTEERPILQWERGHLSLVVDPEAQVQLIVDTPESRVTVLGTVFDVDRDPLGTRVTVARGLVRVDCHAGGSQLLSAGHTTRCWPTTPAGLLGRARTLESRGAPLSDVLDTLDHALATPGPPAVRGELLAHRIRLFQSAGRIAEALEAARQYLAEGHQARHEEIRTFLGDHAD